MNDRILPTTVVGSYVQPDWLVDRDMLKAIVPPRAHFRTDEYRILKSGAFAAWLEENDIRTVGYRPLRDALRERWKM